VSQAPLVLRKSEWIVGQITHASGAPLVRRWHYSKGCSKAGIMFGLFNGRGSPILGVSQWLPPTRVAAEFACKLLGKDPGKWQGVFSLSRLAVHPDVPKNGASFLIGQSVQCLMEAREECHTLVTYADESQGHTGAIYRATNWIEAGITAPAPRWIDRAGRQVAKKATTTRTNAEMVALGYFVDGVYTKRRFLMDLDKRKRRNARNKPVQLAFGF